MATRCTISDYLIERIKALGVRHVFGVPGDYALGFFAELDKSGLKIINTCDEQGAGFAADAYARINGLGVVCVTYCVGGLKIANTTAEAFAEKSPVVVISGAPGMKERAKDPLLHHKVREFDTQFRVFEQLTVASTVLSNPATAFTEIDRVLALALRFKRPVYIELPRDMVHAEGTSPDTPLQIDEHSDPAILKAALAEAAAMINAARQPVIMAGVELHRFGLQQELLQLTELTHIPVAADLLSKSVIAERHPNYIGVYEGAVGREDVREYIESSDCLIMLGTFLSDVNLGVFTAKLEPENTIYATSEKTMIRFRNFEGVGFRDFVKGLIRAGLDRRQNAEFPRPVLPPIFSCRPGDKITVLRLFERLNTFLEDHDAVLADPGDAMFAGADLVIHRSAEFIAPAYYTSMGFAVPAAIGVQLANPKLRPVVLVGDGSFQMTGLELATAVRFNLSPIVIVLNNSGYGTERPMQDGTFNNIRNMAYSKLPDFLGAGRGFNVETEGDLEVALQAARHDATGFCILDVHLDPKDCSPALKRLTESLSKKVHAQ